MYRKAKAAILLAGVSVSVAVLAGCSGGDDRPTAPTAPGVSTSMAGASGQIPSGPAGVPGTGSPGPGLSGAGLPGAGQSGGALIDDPPGLVTCAHLAAAIEAGTLMVPGIVDGIANASRTADAPVADAADRLKSAYARAVAASNTANEPDAVAAVSAAASDMSGVCADSGLRTVG